MSKRLLVPALVVTAVLFGCVQPEPTPPAGDAPAPMTDAEPTAGGKAILFITNANSPFWDAVEAGVTAGSAECGVPARVERNVSGSVDGQMQLLEQAMAQKDELLGVAISVLRPDAEGVLSLMRQLAEAGVPVITIDSDAPADTRSAFVGTNNLEAGRALGEKALELSPFGAKCCVFVGNPSAQNARERLDGFKEGAGENFEVLEVYKDDVEPSVARSDVETALAAWPDVTMLVGLWSYNGPSIAEVVEGQGRGDEIAVVCFDAEPNLLPLLEAGKVDATVVQRPYEFGRQGVKLLKALAEGDQAVVDEMLGDGDVIDTGIVVVTPDTYGEFKLYLDEKGLKSS